MAYVVRMATIDETPEGLHLRMSSWERLGSLHGDLLIPRASVVSSEIVPDPWQILRGWRAPGTGIPFVIMLGTMRYQGLKDFCVIYRRRPAHVITSREFGFSRVIATLNITERQQFTNGDGTAADNPPG
ncbi:unannotated protein [freshwater metagenome]|uniref:Unannotated protein n=1 Tax=freshwater metagenome TaxID=449393 RepID=A0A6J7MBB3_9ZZZZ